MSCRHFSWCTALLVTASMFMTGLTWAQTALTPGQIAQGETLGRTTDHSLKFGTFASVKGDAFTAFLLLPIQRIAYTTSEEASTHHVDILKNEIKLNRMRVSITSVQHYARSIILSSRDQKKSLPPAHLVFEMNDHLADAEFDMPAVAALASPTGDLLIQITDETGTRHPPIQFNLGQLKKSTSHRGEIH